MFNNALCGIIEFRDFRFYFVVLSQYFSAIFYENTMCFLRVYLSPL